jgi:ABC-type antimicrobial peptide transport system permease subunit
MWRSSATIDRTIRAIRRSPVFAAVATLSLAVWIGLSTATFAIGVKTTDPGSLIVAEITFLAVTMVASLISAIRAMNTDPVEVLRAT